MKVKVELDQRGGTMSQKIGRPYCEFYGIPQHTATGAMVNHLRASHRLKIGVDYWVKKNGRGLIVKPIWEEEIREHIPLYMGQTCLEVQVKDAPGRQQAVYTYEDQPCK